ncbi:potassium-transporting ATPase subunit KdpC [Mesorhizobium sp. BE184]|uniref:potassium-transporting ATPase subunit KdpC n=1 Tax=Mesorhizobium sp. BE184 TaxID=2817714 RepID=UPI00286BEBA9|nr:potassium-transporting ATPase subunit KdpC [Mesorhizobium sp. BE184]
MIMLTYIRPALVLTVLFILLTGLAYPLAVTGIGQLAFPAQANGSLIRNGDTVIGSALIGQNFASDRYFWPRPSVTADAPYNAAASTGSNLGPTSAALAKRVQADVERLKASGVASPVAADAATASGSGLDPHISPQFARAQAARVAKARGLSDAEVSALVDSFTEGRLAAIVGEPRVNVLRLNLALDQLKS